MFEMVIQMGLDRLAVLVAVSIGQPSENTTKPFVVRVVLLQPLTLELLLCKSSPFFKDICFPAVIYKARASQW
ncbi:hypothetical protein O9992_20740 [Vibrio lentus]|nr:hypothetical protein [Vibrio lentus]